MFNFNKKIFESCNIQNALNSLSDTQMDEFKKWLINNPQACIKDQLDKAISLMGEDELEKYNHSNDNDIEQSANDEYLQEAMNHDNVKNIMMIIDNTRNLYDYKMSIVHSLSRKKKRGIELNIEQLMNSSMVGTLIRLANKEAIKYESDDLSAIERKALKKLIAEDIFDEVDEYED